MRSDRKFVLGEAKEDELVRELFFLMQYTSRLYNEDNITQWRISKVFMSPREAGRRKFHVLVKWKSAWAQPTQSYSDCMHDLVP